MKVNNWGDKPKKLTLEISYPTERLGDLDLSSRIALKDAKLLKYELLKAMARVITFTLHRNIDDNGDYIVVKSDENSLEVIAKSTFKNKGIR